MDVSAVITEFGAYYREQGQGVKDLMTKIFTKHESMKLFYPVLSEKTVLDKTNVTMGRILQRFQKGWTPKGAAAFVPNKIPLIKLKVDVEETPDDLEESWLGFLASESLDRTQWPFIRWWLENMLLHQVLEDWEQTEVYGGVQAAIVPGTPSADGTATNGLRKQINDAITATSLVPVNTGALETDPKLFVDQIEDWFKTGVPEEYWDVVPHIAMNRANRRKFREGMRIKYNTYYRDKTELVMLDDTNTEIVGVASMAGSDKIWASRWMNAVQGTKKPANQQVFRVKEGDPRQVQAYTDFYKGVGVYFWEYFWTNELDAV